MSYEVIRDERLEILLRDFNVKKNELVKLKPSKYLRITNVEGIRIRVEDIIEQFTKNIYNIEEQRTKIAYEEVFYRKHIQTFECYDSFIGFKEFTEISNPFNAVIPTKKLIELSDENMNEVEFEIFTGLIRKKLKDERYMNLPTQQQIMIKTGKFYMNQEFMEDLTTKNIKYLFAGIPLEHQDYYD